MRTDPTVYSAPPPLLSDLRAPRGWRYCVGRVDIRVCGIGGALCVLCFFSGGERYVGVYIADARVVSAQVTPFTKLLND